MEQVAPGFEKTFPRFPAALADDWCLKHVPIESADEE